MPKRSAEFLDQQRAVILEAARRCFVRDGYDRTTLREVAQEAGLSTGAIYIYFQTKEEILVAICQAQAASQQHALDQAFQSPAPAAPLGSILAAALQPWLSLDAPERRRRELLDLLFWYEATRSPALGDLLRQLLGGWQRSVLAQIHQAQAGARIAADLDPEAISALLIALPLGLVLYDLLGTGDGDPRAWLALVGTLLERGMVPPA